MQKNKIEEWSRKYIENYSLYQEFTRRMKNLLQDLIERENVKVYALEGWAKSPDEFIKKLSSQNILPLDPLKDISDLATVRVLLHFPSDVITVEKIIQEEFLIDLPRSTTSKDLEDPDLFGYKSIIYDVSLKSDRGKLKEWEKYRDVKLHIQVRTMLQEAWASISPEISGVTDIVTKGKLKRKLSRVSALLEEADEDFHYLKEAAKSLSIPVANDKSMPVVESEPEKSVPLSRDLLIETFERDNRKLFQRWTSMAAQEGFPAFDASSSYLNDSADYLLRILNAAEINTRESLEKFLSTVEEDGSALEQLRTVFKAFEEEIPNWRVDPYSAVFLIVLNMKWDVLQNKDLVGLGIKGGSDRIKGD